MKLKYIKRITSILIVVFSILITSCDNNDDLNYNDVAGTYEGTLTVESSKVNSKVSNGIATAVVTMVGNQIEVHCFNDDFDSTIMLNLFEDNDMMKTCLTGSDFENMYCHMIGQGNMNGNISNID